MFYIELTEQSKSNLLAFLNRVNLTGAEVPAFTEIQIAIAKGVKNETDREQARSAN